VLSEKSSFQNIYLLMTNTRTFHHLNSKPSFFFPFRQKQLNYQSWQLFLVHQAQTSPAGTEAKHTCFSNGL